MQFADPALPIEERVEDLLSRMTLAEKIGQMTQVEKNSISLKDVTAYFIGSILSGGGGSPTPNSPEMWAEMVRGFQEAALQTRLGIPLIYGVDAVHGHNNVKQAVIFPHNIGLGATRNAALVEKIGGITAIELLATGVHWNFAPAVSVPQDIRWGRTYEGFSEYTDLVAQLGNAYVRGLQAKQGQLKVLAAVKHFVGDGGTTWGSTHQHSSLSGLSTMNDTSNREDWRIDQGATDVDEATLRAVHLPPYQAAIAAGAINIMVSFSSWAGLKMHAHKYLLTAVLKGELGFEGFLVSDWMAIDQIAADYYACVTTSINAGLDMVMVPFNYKRFIDSLTKAVESGAVAIERIDDAVRRILSAKFQLGLFENPSGDEGLLHKVGAQSHREVARAAVRQSLVLLKNDGRVLPLSKQTPLIFVAGQAAGDIGLQCGGWTIEWQGGTGNITTGTTLLRGIQDTVSKETSVRYDASGKFDGESTIADVCIVTVGETPYAEGEGDCEDLNLSAEDIMLIEQVRAKCEKLIVVLYSGRPLIVTEPLNKCAAFVAAWLPGTEGQGMADVLFGDYPFSGKLSYTWPRNMNQIPLNTEKNGDDEPLFPFGYGLK